MYDLCIALLLLAGPQATATAAITPADVSPAAHSSATTPSASAALEIVVEKKRPDGKAETITPTHVFHEGDVIRLRLVSQFDGFLYITDQGSSGQFSTVFPSVAAGNDNRIAPGKTYLVPATQDGWFQITGPAGFDVFYFLVSPNPLATPAASTFVAPGPASSLRPRCNDAIFRARGECDDISAGPSPVPGNATLPAPLAPIAGAASRDITIVRKNDEVTVKSTPKDRAASAMRWPDSTRRTVPSMNSYV